MIIYIHTYLSSFQQEKTFLDDFIKKSLYIFYHKVLEIQDSTKFVFFSTLENGFNYSLETYCALIMINGLMINDFWKYIYIFFFRKMNIVK